MSGFTNMTSGASIKKVISIRISAVKSDILIVKGKFGAPGKTRTPDPLLRRQLLYPPELQARKVIGL
jgi:hypothetical protein